jgi:hypothetical protein
MATYPQGDTPIAFPVPLLKPSQLRTPSCSPYRWLVQGYLGARMVTALVSRGKSGKTTLASILLSMLKHGGRLAGLAVAPGKAVVVTEESPVVWAKRCERLGIPEDNVRLLCRPFRGIRPTLAQWQAFVANLAELYRQEPFDLLLIDPLAGFLPGGAENYAPAMLDFLLPLQELAQAGPAVWLLHHPGKKAQADGHAGRGSSALVGFVDILIEMSCYQALRSTDRRRRLRAYSRSDDTPRHLLIELNAEGTAYTVPASETTDIMTTWPEVHEILDQAESKLSGKEILALWPEGSKPPCRSTLWRWLKRAATHGRLACQKTDRAGDPYRYWLPERTDMLRPDPSAGPEALAAWRARRTEEIFDRIESCQREHGILPPQDSPAPSPALASAPAPPCEPPTAAAEVLRKDHAAPSTPPPAPPSPALGSRPQADELAPPPSIDSADQAPRGDEKKEADQSSLHAGMLRYLASLSRPS